MHEVEGLIFTDDGSQLLLMKRKKANVYRGLVGNIGDAEEDFRKSVSRSMREKFNILIEKEAWQQFHLRMDRSPVLAVPIWFTYYFRTFDTELLYETYEKIKMSAKYDALLTNKQGLELASMAMPWLVGMALDKRITHSYTNFTERV